MRIPPGKQLAHTFVLSWRDDARSTIRRASRGKLRRCRFFRSVAQRVSMSPMLSPLAGSVRCTSNVPLGATIRPAAEAKAPRVAPQRPLSSHCASPIPPHVRKDEAGLSALPRSPVCRRLLCPRCCQCRAEPPTARTSTRSPSGLQEMVTAIPKQTWSAARRRRDARREGSFPVRGASSAQTTRLHDALQPGGKY